MSIFNRKPKRERTLRATSSRVWRELNFNLLSPILQVEGVYTDDLESILLLTFSIDNEKNRSVLHQHMQDENWQQLSKLTAELPLDLDEVDYDLIYVIYLQLKTKQLLILTAIDKSYATARLLEGKEVGKPNLELFPAKSLIYPV